MVHDGVEKIGRVQRRGAEEADPETAVGLLARGDGDDFFAGLQRTEVIGKSATGTVDALGRESFVLDLLLLVAFDEVVAEDFGEVLRVDGCVVQLGRVWIEVIDDSLNHGRDAVSTDAAMSGFNEVSARLGVLEANSTSHC